MRGKRGDATYVLLYINTLDWYFNIYCPNKSETKDDINSCTVTEWNKEQYLVTCTLVVSILFVCMKSVTRCMLQLPVISIYTGGRSRGARGASPPPPTFE